MSDMHTPRVDFYLLPTTAVANNNFADKIVTACRLIEKAYQASNQVYVHTDSAEQANQLDTTLWTFRDISFVPHALYETELIETPPVRIGYDMQPVDQRDILVNLTDKILNFYQQFQRVIEIVPNSDQARSLAREQYKIYREQGCDLHSHQLEK